jgi:hypothetical protein
MKHVPDQRQKPEPRLTWAEFSRRIYRRASDLADGWKRCDNRLCRRSKQCRGDGPAFKCTDDGGPARTFSQEERAKAMSELYREVKRRSAEFAAGAKPADPETLRKLRDKARRAARRRRESAQAAATRAAPSPPAHGAEAAVVAAEETQLAPEKQERINRACNEHVASLPAEQDKKREPGPRITRL